jgi:mannobiose 2-epimerase
MLHTNFQFRLEFSSELKSIADWWLEHAIDTQYGGFFGQIDNQCQADTKAEKGLVLNTRILWFFSEASKVFNDIRYRDAAERAYVYLENHFRDTEHGGYYWALDHQGVAISKRKQVYGQSFVIYALCSYYSLNPKQPLLDEIIAVFELLEEHALDQTNGGYFEAFSQNWMPIDDLRLSEKDLNYPKTMNTHLHVLEAYTSLHRTCPSEKTERALQRVLGCFKDHIVDPASNHLKMFLDERWRDHSTDYSYGHDIEASWLIWKALEVLDQRSLMAEYRTLVLGLAQSCFNEAVSPCGAIMDEFDLVELRPKIEFPWWVQAEALVGFVNAYELTDDIKYFHLVERIWQFIKEYVIDSDHGEWLWFSRNSQHAIGISDKPCYKAGYWKGPYHNGRAMIEMDRRLGDVLFKSKKNNQ